MASDAGCTVNGKAQDSLCYYSTIDLGQPLESGWRKDNSYVCVFWAAVAAASVALALVGVAQPGRASAESDVQLLSTNFDVGLSHGNNGLEAGVDVNEAGEKHYRGAAVGQGPYGKWRAGITKSSVTGTLTQQVDYSHKEGNTAFKMGLRKVGNAGWKWKAGTETVGEFAFGTGSKAAPAPVLTKMAKATGGKPLVVTAALGVTEGNLKVDAGFKAVDGDVRLRAGFQGGNKGNSWGVNVETPSRDKSVSWRVNLNTGN
eukprot:GGOE01013668.1.p1 GENE.GGOE01013668.1~~GGOE01013668.1.p1  ORF type:complete len:272 (-),score=67.51 GGOE01013668.1:246-1022(-)